MSIDHEHYNANPLYDTKHKSVNGKFIPLEVDSFGQLTVHDCPVKKTSRQQKQVQKQQPPPWNLTQVK